MSHERVDERDKSPSAQPVKANEPSPQQASEVATPAAAAGDQVLTKWMLNYSNVLGRRKDPTRTENDQLVVDELKIQPDAGETRILHGGNAARSGRVHLGDALVARGPGAIAASVRYKERSTFSVKLSVGPARSRSERVLLAQLSRTAAQRALEQAAAEGDYDAIASRLQAELAGEFPGKELSVAIIPARASMDGIVPAEGQYDATSPSTFEIRIDPGDVHEQSTSSTHSESGEDTHAQSHSEGQKLAAQTTLGTKISEAHEIQSKFSSELTRTASDAFKKIQTQLENHQDEHTQTHQADSNWAAGIGPEKDKDDKKTSSPEKKSDGLLGKAWNLVSSAPRWVYRSATNTAKRIPIVSTGISILGSTWDALTTRGNLQHTSGDKDTKSESHRDEHGSTSSQEVDDLTTVATTLASEFMESHKEELEATFAMMVGIESTSDDKHDESAKKSVTNSYSQTQTVYEARRPKISIRKLGGAS